MYKEREWFRECHAGSPTAPCFCRALALIQVGKKKHFKMQT